MQSAELAVICAELGEAADLYQRSGSSPCPCTSASGDYSRDWHRDHPNAENCEGRGVIGGTLTVSRIKCIYQPAFAAGYALGDYIDITQIGQLQESDIIVWSAVFSEGPAELISWSKLPRGLEVVLAGVTYRTAAIVPGPSNEVAVFRRVTA